MIKAFLWSMFGLFNYLVGTSIVISEIGMARNFWMLLVWFSVSCSGAIAGHEILRATGRLK